MGNAAEPSIHICVIAISTPEEKFWGNIIDMAKEEMATIAGGHFAEVAWIMVMLYDYHHGIDFTGDTQASTPFLLNKQNINSYLRIFEGSNWRQIDFSRFSKKHHPKIQRYDFSFNAVMEQFNLHKTIKNTAPMP